MSKKFEKGKMVEFPSTAIIPERDLDKTPVLECRHLGIDFGGLRAVDDFNLTIGRTEIAGLIGPNGAGKTTVFNLLTKVYQPTRGTILLDGMDTSGKTTEQINRMGIARTFQNIRLFSNLTVEDNVKIGLHNQEPYSTFEGIFRLPRYWRQERTAHERALELLSIFDMQDMANVQAGSLPYGAQRRLEIVRALATNPSLLLLDEPAAGMNPSETQELMEALAPLSNSGIPITVHMRQEGSGVEQALEEMIAVGKALRTPVEISHLKSIGKTNWRRSTPNMLRRMELAREEGVEIYCDAYPYTAGSTQLIHILPPECQEGGLGVLSENLREPSFRAHIRHRMETGSDFENISLLVGWENIVASSVTLPQHKCFEGKTIAQIAAMEQKDPFDCAFDLLADEHCAVSMIDFITAEEDIEAILRDETTCVISDSTYPTQGLVHPRVYGTYVRLFERYVRRGVLSPEQAVRKVTALPAARLRLPGKGMLAPGMDADVNVFALEGLHEAGTYGNPRQSAQGMEQVFLAGEPAILHGERTDNICGKVLERVKS